MRRRHDAGDDGHGGVQQPAALLHVRLPLPPGQQERGVQLRQVGQQRMF